MLFPRIESNNHFYLEVDNTHRLYVEECGIAEGIPVVFLHGGPGAGCSKDDRRFFDPDRYRIILFDQRGCGRSRPLAELTDNTTNHLIADIERIRNHLGIDQWVVFGGSWGSTLSLAYAQKHPDKALSLVLRGVFLGSKEENDFFGDQGMGRFFPEEFQRYLDFLPKELRHNPIEAYYTLMTSGDKADRVTAARAYSAWPRACVSLDPNSLNLAIIDDPDEALAEALLEVYYLVNECFLTPGQLLSGLGKIADIPIFIVQGRYDLITPPLIAYRVHQELPNSHLEIVNSAGHYSRDPGTAEGLVNATNTIANTVQANKKL